MEDLLPRPWGHIGRGLTKVGLPSVTHVRHRASRQGIQAGVGLPVAATPPTLRFDSGISPQEVIARDWSAVRPARCQTLFRRGRPQRAFGRNSEDSVEIVYHVGLVGKAASIGNISPSRSTSPLGQDLLDSYTTRKLLRGYPNCATKPAQQLPLAYIQVRGKLVNARRRITPQAGCGATYHGIGFARAHVSA